MQPGSTPQASSPVTAPAPHTPFPHTWPGAWPPICASAPQTAPGPRQRKARSKTEANQRQIRGKTEANQRQIRGKTAIMVFPGMLRILDQSIINSNCFFPFPSFLLIALILSLIPLVENISSYCIYKILFGLFSFPSIRLFRSLERQTAQIWSTTQAQCWIRADFRKRFF